MFYFTHYAIYSKNGIGAAGLKGLGDGKVDSRWDLKLLSVLDLAAQLVFMLVLILLGAGWAITRLHIPYKRVLVVILSLFGVAYLAFFIWENVDVDPASTLYVYESAPGI